jgi:hypothetical protein
MLMEFSWHYYATEITPYRTIDPPVKKGTDPLIKKKPLFTEGLLFYIENNQ